MAAGAGAGALGGGGAAAGGGGLFSAGSAAVAMKVADVASQLSRAMDVASKVAGVLDNVFRSTTAYAGNSDFDAKGLIRSVSSGSQSLSSALKSLRNVNAEFTGQDIAGLYSAFGGDVTTFPVDKIQRLLIKNGGIRIENVIGKFGVGDTILKFNSVVTAQIQEGGFGIEGIKGVKAQVAGPVYADVLTVSFNPEKNITGAGRAFGKTETRSLGKLPDNIKP